MGSSKGLSKADALKLDRQLCFKLYSASRAMIQSYRPLLEKLDLTYLQYLVLLILWEEERASVKRLGERLFLDSGTLTPLLKKMEQRKLVRRKRDPADERVVVIELTPAGLELKKEATEIPEAIFCKSGMEMEEAQQLFGLLGELFEALTKEG